MGGVEIYTKDLGFDYTPSTSTYEITGTAGINIGGITSQNNGVNAPGTNSLSITFGGPIDPEGILIQGGQLVSLDAEINASFWIDDLVQIKATNLEFAYESNYNNDGALRVPDGRRRRRRAALQYRQRHGDLRLHHRRPGAGHLQ